MIRILLTLSLAAAVFPCKAQELGRLFFTPEQRSALDARRKARVPDGARVVAIVSGGNVDTARMLAAVGGRSASESRV